MDKKELEAYLIRTGWQDIKYVPPKYKMLHKEYLKNSGCGIYEKDVFTFRRIKLLKTSMRLEVRGVGGWKKAALINFKDLEIDPETDKLTKKERFNLTNQINILTPRAPP